MNALYDFFTGTASFVIAIILGVAVIIGTVFEEKLIAFEERLEQKKERRKNEQRT